MAFAVRDVERAARPRSWPTRCPSWASCSSSAWSGIIDPLRPSANDAVRIARQAGIEVRMITGDHAITAAAIGAELDLAPGVISGPEIAA